MELEPQPLDVDNFNFDLPDLPEYLPDLPEGPNCPTQNYIAPGPGRPGRLSALSVPHTKSFFVWRFCMGGQGA
jgi:hypothetical protein